MKLIIDTRNGIAGDIVSAALIGLGVDRKQIISSMEYAGNHIGITKIKLIHRNDTIKLEVKIQTDYDHLHESKAKELLAEIISSLQINEAYSRLATKTLDILCNAERYVHNTDERLRHMLHRHHGHKRHTSGAYSFEAILHEAKDIFIDVVGLSKGLQELEVNEVCYLDYVNVGNGSINFSHGEFEVPAPATEYLLNRYNICWKKSDIYEEMTTPTGASILIGCNAKRIKRLGNYRIIRKSLAKGTRNLPPISFYLTE